MTNVNFQNALRLFLERQPFRPFIIKLNNGNSFEIDRPDNIRLDPNRVTRYVSEDKKIHYFDHESVCVIHDREDGPNIVLDHPGPAVSD
jgi:hypothetical protein